jgi:hypothetical protein
MADQEEEQVAEKEVTFHGFTKRDFDGWLHHPCTKLWMQYLRDLRQDTIEMAMERWLAGKLALSTENEAMGRINGINVAYLAQFDAIVNFYGEREFMRRAQEEEENELDGPEPQPS